MFSPSALKQNERRKSDTYATPHHAPLSSLSPASASPRHGVPCRKPRTCWHNSENMSSDPRGVMFFPEFQLAVLDFGCEKGSPLKKCEWENDSRSALIHISL